MRRTCENCEGVALRGRAPRNENGPSPLRREGPMICRANKKASRRGRGRSVHARRYRNLSPIPRDPTANNSAEGCGKEEGASVPHWRRIARQRVAGQALRVKNSGALPLTARLASDLPNTARAAHVAQPMECHIDRRRGWRRNHGSKLWIRLQRRAIARNVEPESPDSTPFSAADWRAITST